MGHDAKCYCALPCLAAIVYATQLSIRGPPRVVRANAQRTKAMWCSSKHKATMPHRCAPAAESDCVTMCNAIPAICLAAA